MKIPVNGIEYKCWHEAGHATVCLHLGGDVDFVEFLVNDSRGHARARCIARPGTERSVACAGYAAEFYLFKNGNLEPTLANESAMRQIALGNATMDGLEYFGRDVAGYDGFTAAETNEFVKHAVGLDGNGGVVPIIKQHFLVMQELVRKLRDTRRVEGKLVKELLRLGNRR